MWGRVNKFSKLIDYFNILQQWLEKSEIESRKMYQI